MGWSQVALAGQHFGGVSFSSETSQQRKVSQLSQATEVAKKAMYEDGDQSSANIRFSVRYS